MNALLRFVPALLLATLTATPVNADDTTPLRNAIVPSETIVLLNGKDLSPWYTWLTDDRYEDPRGVFAIQPDGTLRISGDGFGGLITRDEYANYYLVMEYRWGTKTWRNRVDKARDGGLLLHCQGPDGNFGGSAENPGPWMTSIECQIIERLTSRKDASTGSVATRTGKTNSAFAERRTSIVPARSGPSWNASSLEIRWFIASMAWS